MSSFPVHRSPQRAGEMTGLTYTPFNSWPVCVDPEAVNDWLFPPPESVPAPDPEASVVLELGKTSAPFVGSSVPKVREGSIDHITVTGELLTPEAPSAELTLFRRSFARRAWARLLGRKAMIRGVLTETGPVTPFPALPADAADA